MSPDLAILAYNNSDSLSITVSALILEDKDIKAGPLKTLKDFNLPISRKIQKIDNLYLVDIIP